MVYGSSINPPSILKRDSNGKLVSAYSTKGESKKKKKKSVKKKVPVKVVKQNIPPQVVKWADEMRLNPTNEEQEMIEWFNHYGITYEFQKPIFTGKNYYILDFSMLFGNKKICVEVDGYHHFTRHGKIKDAKRDRELKKMGYTTLRISNSTAMSRPQEMIGLLQFLGLK